MLLLTDTQKATLTLDPRDAKGKKAVLDGVPVWTVADETIATLVVSSDGLTADVVAVDVGATQVNVTADARIGPEVKEIVGTLDVQVSGGEAVSLNISAGAPTEQ